jgi:hypothetical protein
MTEGPATVPSAETLTHGVGVGGDQRVRGDSLL